MKKHLLATLILILGVFLATSSLLAAQKTVTFKGEIVCLPPHPGAAVRTKECALGFKSNDGTFYGLIKADKMFNKDHLSVGDKVKITGKFTFDPSHDLQKKYAIVAVLEPKSYSRLK